LGSVVIQLYAGECTPSVDRALVPCFTAFNITLWMIASSTFKTNRQFSKFPIYCMIITLFNICIRK